MQAPTEESLLIWNYCVHCMFRSTAASGWESCHSGWHKCLHSQGRRGRYGRYGFGRITF